MPTDFAPLAGATLAFDLDGTLVDTAADLIATLNVLLTREDIAPLSLAVARPMIGRGAKALIARGFEAAGAPLAAERLDVLFEQFIDHYRGHIADHSRPFPGLVPALDQLRAAGAILSVCTNKRTDLSVALLDALNLTPYFAAIIGADAVPISKPDPGHLIAAIQRASGSPTRAIMIGDSASDADAARAAGVPLILVSFGYTETPARELGADRLIDHFDALPAACLALLAG